MRQSSQSLASKTSKNKNTPQLKVQRGEDVEFANDQVAGASVNVITCLFLSYPSPLIG